MKFVSRREGGGKGEGREKGKGGRRERATEEARGEERIVLGTTGHGEQHQGKEFGWAK
jgi:hypothetical protein